MTSAGCVFYGRDLYPELLPPEEIISRLEDLSGSPVASGESGDARSLFASLYYFTTRSWSEYARSSSDPVLIDLLIAHFYRLYQIYALEHQTGPTYREGEHWKHHIVLSGKSGSGLPFQRHAALLFGIRAHTRYDLAEAISRVCWSYYDQHRCRPDMDLLRSMIYGKTSDRVFRTACVRFLQAQQDSGMFFGSAGVFFADKLDAIWLPAFQWMRRNAWQDAMTSIRAGVPIERVSSRVKGPGLA